MAELGSRDIQQDEDTNNSHTNFENVDRPNSVNRGREDRVRLVRERQNEERLRKLNEIRQQALQAQRIREQKEEERRRRIEELRVRDTDRRHQVEERKRQIEDAERERRESIVRKNAEREARLETQRKGSRGLASSAIFAFGSSTPRLLEPSDTGGFWSHRRATSTTDMLMFGGGSSGSQSLTSGTASAGGRRSSERENDAGSKKRATSAGGLDRDANEDEGDTSAHSPSVSMYSNRVARRKTDLMPTIPSPRDPMSTSFHHSRQPFTRSPGRAYSMSRLDQLSQPRRRAPELSVLTEQGRVVPHRPLTIYTHAQKSRSSSGGGDISSSGNLSRSMSHLAAGSRPLRAVSMSHLVPVAPPRMNKTERMRRQRLAALATASSDTSGVRSGDVTPSRPGSALSGVSSSSVAGVVLRRPASAAPHHRSGPHRPRPASIAGVTGLSLAAADRAHKNSTSNSDIKNLEIDHQKPPIPHPRTKSQGKVEKTPSKSVAGLKGTSSARGSARSTPLSSPSAENVGLIGSPQPTLTNGHKSTPVVPKRKSSKTETAVEKTLIKNIVTDVLDANLLSIDVTKNTVGTESIEKEANISVETKSLEKTEDIIEAGVQIMNSVLKQATKEVSKVNVQVENLVGVSSDVISDENEMSEKKPSVLVDSPAAFIEEKKKAAEKSCDLFPSNIKVSEVELINIFDNTDLENAKTEMVVKNTSQPILVMNQLMDFSEMTDMTASTMAKSRITTEEEAKAALAERRRLAREEAERQAEKERQRLAEEARLEAERQRAEEEEELRLEEESLRLAKEQREAEEMRLRQAIEEAQKRELEERKLREEEAKQRAEREEAEKRAREEAERQRIELAEKLQKEEKEREVRRKRVEAIMSRTRNRGSAGSATEGNPVQSNNHQDDRPSSAPDANTRNSADESTPVAEKNIVRNGTTGTEMSDNGIDAQKTAVMNENDNIQTQTSIINMGDLIVDNDFNPVVTDSQIISVSPKLPLNGSNIDNVVEQHNVKNANESLTSSPNVITNEDTINSNKSTLPETKSTTDPI